MARWLISAALVALCLTGCDPGGQSAAIPNLYASEVVSFDPGPGAGFGQDKMPGIVLGPPKGGGTASGSLDVVALGDHGTITLGFGHRRIVDGPGPDFIVFENPFFIGGDRSRVFAEPGDVSVSDDGVHWVVFPCQDAGDGHGHWPGCAGWHPVMPYDARAMDPLDPAVTGGDAFDLATIGVSEVRFVRIRDVSHGVGLPPSRGFDLDAIGAIHLKMAR